MTVLEQRKYWMSYFLPKNKETIVICHNDLNNLNILVRADEVFLIDYDYVGYNFIGYDIANLINETSFDYGHPSYPGFAIIKTYTPAEL